MTGRRIHRVARVIKEVASRVLIYDLADPRLGFVTVTDVDVSPDMKNATVKLSVLGDEAAGVLCLRAVQHARGRIQKDVAAALTMKTVPHLEFELDESVKKSVEISRLINLARSEYRLPDDEAGDEPGEEAGSPSSEKGAS